MRVIAGEAKGRALVAPRGTTTRAATERIRESLFATIEHDLGGARVLDLYAGAGSLGIEALSRGASAATFVERDRTALEALRANLRATGFTQRSRVVASSVEAFLRSAGGPYDVVFCDAPFADTAGLGATLAHGGLRAALGPNALVVARALRKHPPALPREARVERAKQIGEEAVYLLRYDAPRPS